MTRRVLPILTAVFLLLGNQSATPEWVLPLAVEILTTCRAPQPVEIEFEQKSLSWLNAEANKNYDWADPRRHYPKYTKGLTRTKDMHDHKVHVYLTDWDTETVVHEVTHYCVYWMTNPGNALLYQEEMTQALTIEFLLMPHIQELIKELKE